MDAEVGIGVAAAQAGVSIETLRYYESAGLLPPRYLGGGRREESCGWASGGRHDVLPLSIE